MEYERIGEPIKNVTYVSEWLFVTFHHLRYLFKFHWSRILRNGTEYGLGGAVRYGVRFELYGTGRSVAVIFCARRFRAHIFRPVPLSS